MSRESLVFLFGIFVLFLPVVGVPPAWKEYALWAIGLALIALGLSLRRSAYLRRIREVNGELRTDSFVESQPTPLDDIPDLSDNRQV